VFAGHDLGVYDIFGCGARLCGAEEGVEAVCYAFYLFDFAVLDCAELDYFAVGRGEDGVEVGIEGTDTGFEGAVEEGGEVRVDV
jgi:hypothetical protein